MIRLTDSGKLCLRATPESHLLKLRKQKLRARKKNEIVDNVCAEPEGQDRSAALTVTRIRGVRLDSQTQVHACFACIACLIIYKI